MNERDAIEQLYGTDLTGIDVRLVDRPPEGRLALARSYTDGSATVEIVGDAYSRLPEGVKYLLERLLPENVREKAVTQYILGHELGHFNDDGTFNPDEGKAEERAHNRLRGSPAGLAGMAMNAWRYLQGTDIGKYVAGKYVEIKDFAEQMGYENAMRNYSRVRAGG